MADIQRPSGVNVGVNNPGITVYIKGNESTDGSLRLNVVPNGGSTVTEIQRRINGIWQPASFKTGANSVLVGTLVELSAAGAHLITTDSVGSLNFLARSTVESGVSTSLATMLNAISFNERVIFRSDESGTFTGTSISTIDLNNTIHLITSSFHFKTGATPASQPVTIRAWDQSPRPRRPGSRGRL